MASAKGIRAGAAYVELFADDSGLIKGLRSAEQSVKKFGQSIVGIGAGIAGLGAAITGPILAASKIFAESGAALANMSARTGVAVETLSTLGFAAQQTGVDITSVEVGIRRMQKSLEAGSEENLQAEASFKALGLSVEDIIRLSPDQQFYAIAKSIAAIQNPTVRGAMAMSIFGRSGEDLVPLMKNLDGLTAQAKEFGLVTSTESAEAAHKFEQSIGLLSATMKKIVTTVGSAVAPQFMEFNITLARGMKNIKDFIAANKPMVMTVYRVGLALTVAGTAIVALGTAIIGIGAVIGGIASILTAIGAAIGFLLSPLGLVVFGLANLAAKFLFATDTGKQALSTLKEDATKAFKGITDALKSGDIALAGQIFWAALKVEFLKGKVELLKIWDDFGIALKDGFAAVSTDIAKGWVDTIAGMQTTLDKLAIKAKEGVKGIFAVGEAPPGEEHVKPGQASPQFVKDAIAGVLQPFKIGEAPPGEERVKPGQAFPTEASIAAREQNRIEMQKALDDQKQAAEDARRKASQEGIAAAQKELDDAKANAAKLAAKALVGGAFEQIPGGPEKPKMPEPGDIDRAVKNAKVDVAGTFSAQAARGLGAGASVQDEQLKEAKKHTDELVKLNKKADRKQMQFN